MLFAWVAAFSLCHAHCALGKNAPMQMPGANQASSGCHGNGCPAKNNDGTGTFCFTVKSLSTDTGSVTLHPPEATAYLQAALLSLPELSTLPGPSGFLVRQTSPPDWNFTPEVSLGPAFRSHAPPTFSN